MAGRFDFIWRSNVSRFNRRCGIIALAFLLLTIGGKIAWYEHRHLEQYQDYPQYYMAGLVARTGAWESLYPIPHEGSQINPGLAENSEMRPAYRELVISHGISERATRFLQPP